MSNQPHGREPAQPAHGSAAPLSSNSAAASRRVAGGLATPLWLIVVLLAFIAGTLVTHSGKNGSLEQVALAQPSPMVGARGVYAFTGLLDSNRAGLFMLDIEQGTIWCYEIDATSGVQKLRLVTGRSWLYDRYLKDFNCASPNWKTVQRLVDQERSNIDPGPSVTTPDPGDRKSDGSMPPSTVETGRTGG